MPTLSPPHKQQPGVMSTGLAWDKTGQTSKKVAQRPEQTMIELAPSLDLIPTTGWETGTYWGVFVLGGGGE